MTLPYLGLIFAVMKYHDEKNLGKEHVYFTVPYNSSSSKAMRVGTQSGQNSGRGN